MKANKIIGGILLLAMLASSCGQSFLDVKPTVAQRVPVSIQDFLGLMDNTTMMNTKSSHALGIIGGDEFYIEKAKFDAFPTINFWTWQRNAYIWSNQIYEGGEGNPIENPLDWNMGYERILWANLVLDGLKGLVPAEGERDGWNNAKGIALFHRAFNYYTMAQLYCPVYQRETEASALGLPLRLEADLTLQPPRSTLRETYDRILLDLEQAALLLPDHAEVVFRPGKNTVYALLARIYLQLGDYQKGLSYAEACLDLGAELMDYNALDLSANPAFPAYGESNPEIVFMNSTYLHVIFRDMFFSADSNLMKSYEAGDLRKAAFFTESADGSVLFKGSYEGSASFFTGIATDEVYLIRAECLARVGRVGDAMQDLNWLRRHRMQSDQYVELSADDAGEALDWIVKERRKELVLRGIRWEDLRRFNKEDRHSTTLLRQLGDLTVELPPNDLRYVWPIPLEAIREGGYEQNQR